MERFEKTRNSWAWMAAVLMALMPATTWAQDNAANDKTEEKNRNVMLNATTQSKPREISIGLPGSDWGTLIFEDGLPVCFSSWPVFYYFRWAGGNAHERQGLMKIGETGIRSSEVGYAINSYTRLGGERLGGAATLSASHYGMMKLDAALSGPMGRGWYFNLGAYANYDPSSVRQPTRRFVNQSQIYKLGLTKRWNEGRTSLSLLYKYALNNDATYGYNTAPFYYVGDGSIRVYEGFRMGRDSYLPTDDRVEYTDVATGDTVSRRLRDMNRKHFHDATLLFAHRFRSGWQMNWNTRLAFARGMDNLGLFENGISTTADGPVQQRMGLLCHSDATDLLSTLEFTRRWEKHALRLGLNEWNSWQKTASSSFTLAHRVGPRPERVLNNGRLTWNHNVCAEYYDGWENKTVLYATDDWTPTPRLNLYYGLRLEAQSLAVRSANNREGYTGNSRTDGWSLASPTASLSHRNHTWVNPIGMFQGHYRIGRGLFLTAEYSYTRQHPGAVTFKYAEPPILRPTETQLARAGVQFETAHFGITSLFSLINKSGNNGAGHFTKLINGAYETQTGSSFYDIRTLGWTTDANLSWRGLSLHLLATLQSPYYKNFSNHVSFSDGSRETFDYSDNYVSGISRVLLEIDPAYEWKDRWRVWASFRYYSKQYANKLNNVCFDGHWETFAGAQYRHSRFTFGLNAVNLLNQTGASGTIDVADTMTDTSQLRGYLMAGTFIRPFTLEFSTKVDF